MVADLPEDQLVVPNPADVYVWDAPKHLPHDRTIWKTRGDVRGNFPGFEHADGVISDAEIRLTSNMLTAVSKRGSFGIPSGAMQRVALEAGGDHADTSIISVDYADGLGQPRRLWLVIETRRRLAFPRRSGGFVVGFSQAGVQDLKNLPLVAGIHRMNALPPDLLRPHTGVRLTSRIRVSLASGDYPADLVACSNHLEVRCAELTLALPYEDVLGLITAASSSADHHTTFLVFSDDGALLGLRIAIPYVPVDDHAPAAELLAFLQGRGVRHFAAGDPHTYFVRSRESSRQVVNHVPPVYPVADEARQITWEDSAQQPDSGSDERVLSSTWVGAARAKEWRPFSPSTQVATPRPTTLALYQELLMQIANELLVCESLHEQQLLTESEFVSQRKMKIYEWQLIYRLIQLGLLRDAGLISDTEFEQLRRQAMLLSRTDATTDDGWRRRSSNRSVA